MHCSSLDAGRKRGLVKTGTGGVVEIKRRNRLAQSQVGPEVRWNCSDVLPIAAIDIRLHALVRDGVGDDVPAEVNQLRVGHCLFQNLSFEDIDAH